MRPARSATLAAIPVLRSMICKEAHIWPPMAGNLSVDPKLTEQALQVSGERTKAAAVTKALQEFIARRRQ